MKQENGKMLTGQLVSGIINIERERMTRPTNKSRVLKAREALMKAVEKNLPDTLVKQFKTKGQEQCVGLSLDKEFKVAYADREEDWFTIKRRKRTTLQRYITRQLEQEIPSGTLNDYVQKVHLDCYDLMDKKHFTVVKGQAIVDAYEEEYGCESCMTGDSCCTYTSIYGDNPKVVSMLLYDGVRKARVLLWNTNEGVKVLDRVYPSCGLHMNIIEKWAEQNGFIWRKHLWNDKKSVHYQQNYTVTLNHWSDYLPYADTFIYFKFMKGNKIECCCNYISEYDHSLGCTEGGYC